MFGLANTLLVHCVVETQSNTDNDYVATSKAYLRKTATHNFFVDAKKKESTLHIYLQSPKFPYFKSVFNLIKDCAYCEAVEQTGKSSDSLTLLKLKLLPTFDVVTNIGKGYIFFK